MKAAPGRTGSGKSRAICISSSSDGNRTELALIKFLNRFNTLAVPSRLLPSSSFSPSVYFFSKRLSRGNEVDE